MIPGDNSRIDTKDHDAREENPCHIQLCARGQLDKMETCLDFGPWAAATVGSAAGCWTPAFVADAIHIGQANVIVGRIYRPDSNLQKRKDVT